MSTPFWYVANGRETVFLAPMLVNNIKKVRERKGLSRPRLAAKCVPPTSYQQIEKLEKGLRSLRLDWIIRLAEAMEVDPIELIADSEPPENQPLKITLDEQPAIEAARTFGLVALGEEPEAGLVKDLATMLQEFVETFAAHPATRRDPQQVRPVADLLARRYVRQSH